MPAVLRRPLLVLTALALLALPLRATWSFVVVNRKTGEVAVCSATCLESFDLQRWVPVVIVEVGGAAAQSQIDIEARNRMRIWERMRLGSAPVEILAYLDSKDPAHQGRQYGFVDMEGRALTFTGLNTGAWAGGVTGQVGDIVYSIQGNVLTGQPVVDMAEQALLSTPGTLSDKLMAAMEAAMQMGGDGRCSCSQAAPTSCGSPPPSFTKSAHVAFMVLSRPGDTDGTCNSIGCATGDYYMDLNVRNQRAGDPDPVIQLRGMYDAWRADLAGRPDANESLVAMSRDSVPPDFTGTVEVFVDLADLDGAPIGHGGHTFSLVHDPRSAGLSTLDSVTDHGDGTYTLRLRPGAGPGLDRLRFVVDDGVRPVTLWPPATLLHEPPQPEPLNDLEAIPGLDEPGSRDRQAFLVPGREAGWLLSLRDQKPLRLLRAVRPSPAAPFGPAHKVPDVNGPARRFSDFWVSADERRLTLSGFAGKDPVERIFQAFREKPDPFGDPVEAEEFNSGAGDGGPFLAAHELEMVFHSRRPGGAGGWDLWRARRLGPEGIWLDPEPVAAVNTPGDERYPMLAANGTRLVFSRRTGPGDQEELWFSHLQPDGHFGPDAPLPGGQGKGPRMTATAEEGGAWTWITMGRASGNGDVLRARATPDALQSSGGFLSASAGGGLDFSLDAGAGWAGSRYALVLGASGPVPGLRLGPAVLPLAGDGLTALSLARPGLPPFTGFQGNLDADGRAVAALVLPAGAAIPPELQDRTLRAAFLASRDDRCFASNAVTFTIRP